MKHFKWVALAIFVVILSWLFFGQKVAPTPTEVLEEVAQRDVGAPETKTQENSAAETPAQKLISSGVGQPSPPIVPAAPSNNEGPSQESSKLQMPSTKRITRTGAEYFHDSSRPSLAEAYRDSKGLIWGDVLGFSEDHEWGDYLSFAQAVAYCAKEGNRLPTKEEFERLAHDLGYGSDEGYSRYVKDDVNETTNVLAHLGGGGYWSSTIAPGKRIGYAFHTSTGGFLSWKTLEANDAEPIGHARCVFDSAKKKADIR